MAQDTKNDDSTSVATRQDRIHLESSVVGEQDGELQPGMTVTVTNEETGVTVEHREMEEGSQADSDDVGMDDSVSHTGYANHQEPSSGRNLAGALSQQQEIGKDGLVSSFVQGLEAQKRYPRRLGSAVPQRMADSASQTSSARGSPTPSSSGMSPTKASSRYTRRAAARGKERTSSMIHNPFGVTKNGRSGLSTVGLEGNEHTFEVSQGNDEIDEPGTVRCTVCLQVMEPVWISNRYIEQCRR